MKKIVKKIIKSLIILLILFSIVSTIIFTSISSSNEPRKWVPYHNGMFGFAEKHYQNINGYCVFFNRYNFTESQGDISIGFFSCINGNTTGTQLRGCYSSGFIPFQFSVCILGDNLSFPYDAISLQIGNITLSSSGPILMNVSAYNDSNILTALSSCSGNVSQPTQGYKFQNSPPGPYIAYVGRYNIWTSHNFTTETQHYMRTGNYSMNFSFHFTPIFEFGPYYVTGNQLNISFAWRWTILPTRPYVPL
jgi:hypothetical protein